MGSVLLGTKTRRLEACATDSSVPLPVESLDLEVELKKNARARPQPPPGRVERLAPASPCAVKDSGGLWHSHARPDRRQNTSAISPNCLSDVGHL